MSVFYFHAKQILVILFFVEKCREQVWVIYNGIKCLTLQSICHQPLQSMDLNTGFCPTCSFTRPPSDFCHKQGQEFLHVLQHFHLHHSITTWNLMCTYERVYIHVSVNFLFPTSNLINPSCGFRQNETPLCSTIQNLFCSNVTTLFPLPCVSPSKMPPTPIKGLISVYS